MAFRSCGVAMVLGLVACGPQVDAVGLDESGSSSGDAGSSTGDLVTSATLTHGSDPMPPMPPGETSADETTAGATTSGDTESTVTTMSVDASDGEASSAGASDGSESTGAVPACGDGTIDPGEQCDDDDLDGWTCERLGLDPGVLSCDPMTCTFDTRLCFDGPAGCGDGTVDPGEQCDGANLQGFDCASLGLAGGTLACDPITCTFDTSMCSGGGGGTTG